MINNPVEVATLVVASLTLLLLVGLVVISRAWGRNLFLAEIDAVRLRANRLHEDLDKQLDINAKLVKENIDLGQRIISVLEKIGESYDHKR